MLEWLKLHVKALAVGSLALVLLTALIGVAILVRLPEDYFLQRDEPPVRRRSVMRIFLLVLKNLAGMAMIVLGAVMALPLIPGPGLILVIVGLSLTNFPGRRKLELRLLHLPMVLAAINKLRDKTGRGPFLLPP